MHRIPFIAAALTATLAIGCHAELVPETPAAEPPPAPEAPAAPAPPAEPEKKTYKHVQITEDHLVIDQKIHFGNDSDVIQPDSNDLLEEIAEVLKEHSEIARVDVVGHTDSNGDDMHNKDLSTRRAASVAKALRGLGVSTPIETQGAGEEQPACTENSDACHEQNRRVEFKIVKKGRLGR